MGGEEKYGTVLFCDIVGFTSMSEHMTAVEVIDRLNRYFMLVTDVVTRNSGTLHKFEGDMVMAFWNVLFADAEAEYHSIRTGIEMQLAVWLFGLGLEAEGEKPIHLGVGCNTGEFAGGNIGGKDVMEYTVIGDNINVGKRIEALSGASQIFVTDSTLKPVKDKCNAIGLPETIVKGKDEPVKPYSIRGLQVTDSQMLLCLPVYIKNTNEENETKGIISSSQLKDNSITLFAPFQIQVGKSVTLLCDISELDVEGCIEGTVVDAQEIMKKDIYLYSKITISRIIAPDNILAFFKPGLFVESPKKWDQMKRV